MDGVIGGILACNTLCIFQRHGALEVGFCPGELPACTLTDLTDQLSARPDVDSLAVCTCTLHHTGSLVTGEVKHFFHILISPLKCFFGEMQRFRVQCLKPSCCVDSNPVFASSWLRAFRQVI